MPKKTPSFETKESAHVKVEGRIGKRVRGTSLFPLEKEQVPVKGLPNSVALPGTVMKKGNSDHPRRCEGLSRKRNSSLSSAQHP